MNPTLRVLVVDDEPYARRRMVRMVNSLDEWIVVGQAKNGVEAKEQILALRPDVVLLDIRMPGMDGLALARQTEIELPPIVFTTAYDEYAVDAFDAEAVDYLLKPVELDRLAKALERVRLRGSARSDASSGVRKLERLVSHLIPADPPRLSAKKGDTTHLFDLREITSLRAEDDYVSFESQGSKFLLQETLDALERRLAAWGFLRVHRSYLANLNGVVGIHQEDGQSSLVLRDGSRLPVSRRRIGEVRCALGIANGSD